MANEVQQEIQEVTKNRYYGSEALKAIKAFFGNYVNFKGRSDRREFWWWTLWNFVIQWVLFFVLFMNSFSSLGAVANTTNTSAAIGDILGSTIASSGIAQLWSLVIFLPTLSLGVRRFRDAGVHWGWFVAITVVPVLIVGMMFGQIFSLAAGTTTDSGLMLFYSLIILACLVANLVISLLKSKGITLHNGKKIDNHGRSLTNDDK